MAVLMLGLVSRRLAVSNVQWCHCRCSDCRLPDIGGMEAERIKSTVSLFKGYWTSSEEEKVWVGKEKIWKEWEGGFGSTWSEVGRRGIVALHFEQGTWRIAAIYPGRIPIISNSVFVKETDVKNSVKCIKTLTMNLCGRFRSLFLVTKFWLWILPITYTSIVWHGSAQQFKRKAKVQDRRKRNIDKEPFHFRKAD